EAQAGILKLSPVLLNSREPRFKAKALGVIHEEYLGFDLFALQESGNFVEMLVPKTANRFDFLVRKLCGLLIKMWDPRDPLVPPIFTVGVRFRQVAIDLLMDVHEEAQ